MDTLVNHKQYSYTELKLLKEHWQLPTTLKQKLTSYHMRVWSSSYLLETMQKDKGIIENGLKYQVELMDSMQEILDSEFVGISFRQLTDDYGIALVKYWSYPKFLSSSKH